MICKLLWALVRVFQVFTVLMLPVAITMALALAGEPQAVWLVRMLIDAS